MSITWDSPISWDAAVTWDGVGEGTPPPTPPGVSLADFTVGVEIAPADTPRTASPTYVDVTSYVRASAGVSLTAGRSNEFDPQAQPGTASFELRNTDARFTVGNAASPYAPVQIRRPCRVRVTHGGVVYPLWQGFVDSWGNGRDGTVGVTRVKASDRLARAGMKLPAALLADMLADSPSFLFPLGDAFGSTRAGDVSGARVPSLTVTQVGSGGSLDFGSGTAPGPDEGTVAAFTRVDATNGKRLVSAGSTPLNGSTTGETLAAMVRPSTTSAQMSAARAYFGPDTFGYCDLGVSSTGKARAVINDGVSVSVTLTGTSTLSTTATSDIAVTQSAPSSGTVTVRLYVNGVQEATTTYTRDLVVSFDRLTVGGTSAGDMWDGQVSHVRGYLTELSASRLLSHANGRTGWVGELSGARFERQCMAAGLPSGSYTATGTGSATMAAQPTAGRTLLEVVREIAEAELGVVYVDPSGVLTLGVRGDRYNVPVALTLDATKPGHVGMDFTAETDDAYIVNDYTVDRPGGATQRVVDAASVAAYDTHAESATLYVDSDDQARTAAEWRVFTGSQPSPRTSSLTVDAVAYAASGADVSALMGVRLGDRVQVVNLPSDTSATPTLDLFVEGVAWRIEKETIRVTLTVSPMGAAGAVFVWDDPTYGRWDTGGVWAP